VNVLLRYGASAAILVALVSLLLWPFLGAPHRAGVLAAAAVALPVQVVAFSVLMRFHGRVQGFMAAWVGGMALRVMVVVAVAFLMIRSGSESAVSMLLALAGFFFALVLLEPMYFRTERGETA